MSRRSSKWLLIGAAVLAAVAVILIVLPNTLEPSARAWVIRTIEQRFDSKAELKNLNLTLFPRIGAAGGDLVIRKNGRTDIPPLIALKKFSVQAGLLGFLRSPTHIGKVTLEGLQIQVPPHRDEDTSSKDNSSKGVTPIVVDEIVANDSVLKILPKAAGKDPLIFDLYRLTLLSVRTDQPFSFRATLKNAKPPGLIETTGDFGPWHTNDPGMTPVSGKYQFKNADLSVFKGIGGILASNGKFNGILERLEVDGSTDTPDFMVQVSGHPVHLKTQFHSIVDGTDGDTLLQPVDGQFLRSSVHTWGGVTKKDGDKGKTVALDVTVENGRVEDMLRLAVKSDTPVMDGSITFRAKLEIPPGDVDVVEKMDLNGTFGIGSAKFSSTQLQEKVAGLSHRAQGEPEKTGDNVYSNFHGHFVLRHGVVTFSNLAFSIPGAHVSLNGSYGLVTEALDFKGTVRMQATISEMTTGVKSFFLKLLDPFFEKKGAGAVIPIKITGTRNNPSIGLNL